MRIPRLALFSGLFVSVLVHSACSAAVWNGVAAGLAGAGGVTPSVSAGRLMLFGGENHTTFLGCVNCNQYDSTSIYNGYGSYGSAYSPTSIANHYAEFGSKYSAYGACNPYASDPPVIVDDNGQFYGRLTVNQYHAQRTHNTQLLVWLAAICE
jgi:hypothetical protein